MDAPADRERMTSVLGGLVPYLATVESGIQELSKSHRDKAAIQAALQALTMIRGAGRILSLDGLEYLAMWLIESFERILSNPEIAPDEARWRLAGLFGALEDYLSTLDQHQDTDALVNRAKSIFDSIPVEGDSHSGQENHNHHPNWQVNVDQSSRSDNSEEFPQPASTGVVDGAPGRQESDRAAAEFKPLSSSPGRQVPVIDSQLHANFEREAQELVAMIGDDIDELSRNPDDSEYHRRLANSSRALQQTANGAGYTHIAQVSGAIERLFGKGRDSKVSVDNDLLELLTVSWKLLRVMVHSLDDPSTFTALDSPVARHETTHLEEIGNHNGDDVATRDHDFRFDSPVADNHEEATAGLTTSSEFFAGFEDAVLTTTGNDYGDSTETEPAETVAESPEAALRHDTYWALNDAKVLRDMITATHQEWLERDAMFEPVDQDASSMFLDDFMLQPFNQPASGPANGTRSEIPAWLRPENPTSSREGTPARPIDITTSGHELVAPTRRPESTGTIIRHVENQANDVTTKQQVGEWLKTGLTPPDVPILRGRLPSTSEDRVPDRSRAHDAASATSVEARGVQFSKIEPCLQRFTHDQAGQHGKIVRLMIEGGNTLIDVSMLERISVAVKRLVKLAIFCRIERPEVRRSLAKPEHGTIRVRARRKTGATLIEIVDDGTGEWHSGPPGDAGSNDPAAGFESARRAFTGTGVTLEIESITGLGTAVTIQIPDDPVAKNVH